MIEILEYRLGKTLYLATLEKVRYSFSLLPMRIMYQWHFFRSSQTFSQVQILLQYLNHCLWLLNIVLWCRVFLKEYPGLKGNTYCEGPKNGLKTVTNLAKSFLCICHPYAFPYVPYMEQSNIERPPRYVSIYRYNITFCPYKFVPWL